MINKVWYVVCDPNTATGLDLVSLNDFMAKADMREIVKPGSEEECKAFMADYTAEKPYVLPAAVQADKITEARSKAGIKRKDVPAIKEYPLIPNGTLTDEEKVDIITKAVQDVGYLLHATLIYTGETRSIDATVTMNGGEQYTLTFKRITDGDKG
jgi:hypothetical protein